MITVNAMGDACPIPVIKTKKALEENKGQDTVEVLVDNETAVKNVTKMAESLGTSVTQEKKSEGEYRILIQPSKTVPEKPGKARKKQKSAVRNARQIREPLWRSLLTGWEMETMNWAGFL